MSIRPRRCFIFFETISACKGPGSDVDLASAAHAPLSLTARPFAPALHPSSVRTEITTLEGISPNGKLHPLQQAWIDEQVPQCGFCQNGQIMTAKAMLDKNPHPTDAQIRETMNGTLCRCFSHYRIQTAIRRVVNKGVA
jgi:xanthine dehydrogenase iron-sulfur cluster and FAD-binding subunit A